MNKIIIEIKQPEIFEEYIKNNPEKFPLEVKTTSFEEIEIKNKELNESIWNSLEQKGWVIK